ncbi:hypothetical protein N9948_01155 [bacterium]|nr:hypothetical protein [bacterium]
MSNTNSSGNSTSGTVIEVDVDTTQQLILPDKKDIIKEDPLLKGLLGDDGTFDLLDIVIAELAEEGASLKYERIKKEFDDQPTDRISLRRANILKMITDALIQKRNLALNDFVNLRSPQWQIVFSELMDKVRQTFDELGYSSEQMELFFDKLQNSLEGFEEDTELKLKESLSKQG